MINVFVWAEDRPLPEHEKRMRELYPDGIEGRLREVLLSDTDICVRTATMQDRDQGFSDEILKWADVLVLWSHKNWRELKDIYVEAVWERVLEGMGIVVLHSAHASKIFARLMGTKTQRLHWKENDERQRYWVVAPGHPIVQGIDGEYFDIPADETYGEYFDIPHPDELVFLTVSEGGEVFRSGCCWRRGKGRIFYFQAGHETCPVYYQEEVMAIIINAVKWTASVCKNN